jgi:hypothetical protein
MRSFPPTKDILLSGLLPLSPQFGWTSRQRNKQADRDKERCARLGHDAYRARTCADYLAITLLPNRQIRAVDIGIAVGVASRERRRAAYATRNRSRV